MQELPNPDAESEDSVDDEPSYRPCGCPLDYHLSDCPIITPSGELDFEERYFQYHNEEEWDWYTRSLNGDY